MKNLTKKLSLLIALCMIVTVGGVYATWSFADGATTNTVTETRTINMQDYIGAESAAGHLEVLENTIRFTVTDNKSGNVTVGENEGGDSIAELEATGHLVIIFKPFSGNTEAVAHGIPLDLTFGQTGTLKYDGKDIFTVSNGTLSYKNTDLTLIIPDTSDETGNTVTKEGTLTTLKKAVGADAQAAISDALLGDYYIIIDAATILQYFHLNGTFTLSTLSEYNDFQSQLGLGNFQIIINEGTASAASLE